MTITVPVVWPISGGIQQLELPPGFTDSGFASAASMSVDGSGVVGYYNTDSTDGNDYPCRWDDGVLTTLTGPDITPNSAYPVVVSQDGSTVLGADSFKTQLFLWTTPTNGTLLSPLTGDTAVWSTHNDMIMSDDGTIVIGISKPSTTNTVWTNGVPSSWGLASDSYGVEMSVCSGDGLTIIGESDAGLAGYWRSHTFYLLTNGSIVLGCNYNGTIIYGSGHDVYGVLRQCYWDNLTSVTGSADFGSGTVSTYGTLHILPYPGSATLEYAARTANVVVGLSSGIITHAAKWVNGVYTDFQFSTVPPEIIQDGRAIACNGDGTIVVGDSSVGSDPNYRACYWDSDNVQHMLPGISTPYGNTTRGISRDGTMMFGDANIDGLWWNMTGGPSGAVGDLWSDPSFVDFSDSSVRVGFINVDNSWKSLGLYGELPTGTSPTLFLTVQDTLNPYSFLDGWGNTQNQSSWAVLSFGNDPTTGMPYAQMTFDACGPTIIIPTILSMDNLDVTAIFHDVHQVFLRNSNDAGASWGNAVGQSLGEIGEFDTSIQWRRTSYARDRIFEISWSSPVLTSLVGVFVDFQSESS